MRKTLKPDYLSLTDPEARKKAVEEAVRALDEKSTRLGEPEASMSDVKSRYAMSCSLIMWCSLIGTVFLALASLYFMTLPRPYSYISTQEGKLYEIQPYKVEK